MSVGEQPGADRRRGRSGSSASSSGSSAAGRSRISTVDAYFAAIRARDADALGALFTADAQLVTLAGTFTGPDAIAGFYRELAFAVADLWPEPGPLLVDGDRIAVEIRLRMNGTVSLVGDFFTLRDDRITRLVIYSGPPAASA